MKSKYRTNSYDCHDNNQTNRSVCATTVPSQLGRFGRVAMPTGLPDGWCMHHYSDEVTWWDESLGFPVDLWACEYPFVPGFFVAVLVEDENVSTPATSYPIAGPFKTLRQAIATIKLIRP